MLSPSFSGSTSLFRLGLVPDHVLLGALAHSEGVDRIVLREDKRVADLAGIAAGDEFLLPLPGVRIPGPAPIEGRKGLADGSGGAHAVNYSQLSSGRNLDLARL